jgi:N-acetylglucosaminyldiphosphoundecaprenol N-acetyl-beta-D-mannosaminyltransferase
VSRRASSSTPTPPPPALYTQLPLQAPDFDRRASARRPLAIQILSCRVDQLTLSDAVEWIKSFLADGRPHQVVTANPLMLLETQEDPLLAEVFQHASLVVPESAGVVWASQQLGTPLDMIVPGIDLLDALCKLARDQNKSIFLLGAEPNVAEAAAVTLSARYAGLRIIGTQHGYFSRTEETAIVARIHELAPDFLFVGMNVPQQERWIYRHLQALNVPVVMGVGGSFDVLSGRLRRAPHWMRELGLEWLFRTLQEPKRLSRIARLPVFVWKVLTHN